MTTRNFAIEFSDLKFEVQEEIVESVKESLLDSFREEGQRLFDKEWHVKPKTWQEAYCREYAVDWRSWNELDEQSLEFQDFDWEYTLEEHIKQLAEERCYQGMHHMQLTIDVRIVAKEGV